MYRWSTLIKIVLPVTFLLLFFTYSNVFSSPLPTTAGTPEPRFIVDLVQPEISAKSFTIFDVTTGEVLASKNPDMVLPIASVTKLVTATALVNSLDLNLEGTVAEKDIATEGEAGKLQVGEKYQYRELLFPLLLESSNDAAAFFERETNGEIILAMNLLVHEIGMSNTKLVDASGLSDNNLSTGTDLIKLVQYLNTNQSYILDITRLKQYVGPYSGYLNNNPVLDSSYKGGKHGYTLSANRTLVSLFEEGFGQNKRIIGYVLLGSDDLTLDTQKLRTFVANSVTYE